MAPEEWPIAPSLQDEGTSLARPAGRHRLATVRKDFFLDPEHRLTEQERALMTAMLADLLGTIADEIRAALPTGWAAANDDDHQNLLRELSSAGLLDHLELIATLLRRADEERIANAVRSRSGPGGAFLQALIADDNESVSAAAMALILARGRRRDRLGQPRIEFEDLGRPLARSLAQSVAAALRRHARGVARGEADTRFAAAAAALIERRDEAKAVDRLASALVEALDQAGSLDERLLEAAAEEGDLAFLAQALANRSEIHVTCAWDHLIDGDEDRLVLLLRMARVSRNFAASLLALLGDLVGITDVGRAIGRFDSMNDAEVGAARDRLQLDSHYQAALGALGTDDGKRAV